MIKKMFWLVMTLTLCLGLGTLVPDHATAAGATKKATTASAQKTAKCACAKDGICKCGPGCTCEHCAKTKAGCACAKDCTCPHCKGDAKECACKTGGHGHHPGAHCKPGATGHNCGKDCPHGKGDGKACACKPGDKGCACGKDCACPHCKGDGKAPCACKHGDKGCACGKDCSCPHCKGEGKPCQQHQASTAATTAPPAEGKDMDLGQTQFSANNLFRVSFISSPIAVPVNQMHTWTLTVMDADGKPVTNAEITVDGGMPAHGHGMPTQPKVTKNLGIGNYLVEGMKFSMPGHWVMEVTVKAGGKTDKTTFNLML